MRFQSHSDDLSESDREQPLVTIIMPVRNEEAFIERSLGAVLEQDYPSERLEVLVIDGRSQDQTQEIVECMITDNPMVRLLDNPRRIVPVALNIGLRHARGEIVVRVDGHCLIDRDYVSRCVEYLISEGVECVGGPIDTMLQSPDAWSVAIAVAMGTHFGVGGSSFRTAKNRKMLVGTVAFPAYTREALVRVGAYDEELASNEDDDYNYRLRRLGGRILMVPDIHSSYYCRSSLEGLARQYFQYGRWKVRVLQKSPRQMRFRQLVPPALAASLAIGLLISLWWSPARVFFVLAAGSYVLANLIASTISARRVGWRHGYLLPVVFTTMHLSYGSGFLIGLICFWNRWLDHRGKTPALPAAESSRSRENLDDTSVLIFDDQLLRFDGEQYSSSEAYMLFVIAMRHACPQLSFLARETSDSGPSAYLVPTDIDLVFLPPYESVPRLISEFPRWAPCIWGLLRRNIDRWDVMMLAWPHPVTLLALVLARFRRSKPLIVLVVRQNLQQLVKLRYRGLHRAAASAVVRSMESGLRWVAANPVFFTVGDEMYRLIAHRNQRVYPMTFPFVSRSDLPNLEGRPWCPASPLRLLFVGRLEPEKGLPHLLVAVHRLLHDGIDVELDLAGSGRDIESLAGQAERLGIDDNIHFHGYVQFGQDLFDLYRRADLFVLPSLSEGFPSVLLEAMAFGVPIVATRVGGVDKLLRHGHDAWLVAPGSAEQLTAGVNHLLGRPAFTETLRRRARRHGRESLTLEAQCRHVVDILHQERSLMIE